MLSSIVKPSSFSLTVLLFFSFALLTHSGKVVPAEKICEQSHYPTFCYEVFNSMPGGVRGKDLVSLGEYAVDVAQTNLSSLIALLKSLINNATDPAIKRRYEKYCYATYTKEAVKLLQRVKSYLIDGNHNQVSYEGATLMMYSAECGDEIPNSDTMVSKSNKDMSRFGNIIVIIGDSLKNS